MHFIVSLSFSSYVFPIIALRFSYGIYMPCTTWSIYFPLGFHKARSRWYVSFNPKFDLDSRPFLFRSPDSSASSFCPSLTPPSPSILSGLVARSGTPGNLQLLGTRQDGGSKLTRKTDSVDLLTKSLPHVQQYLSKEIGLMNYQAVQVKSEHSTPGVRLAEEY